MACQVHILPVLLHGTGVEWRVDFAGVVVLSAVDVASPFLVRQVVLWAASARVPPVVAASPGHIGGDGVVEVVHGPGEHDYVVYVEPEGHDSGRIAHTCHSLRKFAKLVVADDAPRCLMLPLKTGQIRHTPSPPMPKYWPSEASRKKAGMPARMRQNKYGTRKAPANTTKSTVKRINCFFLAKSSKDSSRRSNEKSQPKFLFNLLHLIRNIK